MSGYDRYSLAGATGRYTSGSYAHRDYTSGSGYHRPSYSRRTNYPSYNPSYSSGSTYSSSRYPTTTSRRTHIGRAYHAPVTNISTDYWSHRPTPLPRARQTSPDPPKPVDRRKERTDNEDRNKLMGKYLGTGSSTSSSVAIKPDVPAEPKPAPTVKPAKILKIDPAIDENAEDHHTDKYEMCQEGYIDDLTKKSCPAQLVVRRGQEFRVKIFLDRIYNTGDHIRIVTTIGALPLRSKGTHNEIVTGEEHDDWSDWKVRVILYDGNKVELGITSHVKCAVGKWDLAFDTIKTDDSGEVTKLMEESVKTHAYVLFNAWCKEDPVYMEKEDWREEYVLNDSGKVYTGNYKQIFGKPWNFGQFESCVLQAALYLLDELTYIPMTSRGNPIIISRKMSALVNSSDDDGVLTGNWSGDYTGGVSPTKWTGSVKILQQYMDTKSPVNYGQCWVFSGVMTSICRSIGIPTRSVTNFASAHDTDGSLTIDVHWDADDNPMPELDSDSVWNFHVWNECWMARPDLQKGYGGWQAVDATPQETSEGIYCAGPASVVAIKNGDVGTSYDAPFVFAEVNADKVHWCKQKDGSILKILQRDVVGKKISTKAVGSSDEFSWRNLNPDREDLTLQYKYPEGSQAERSAVWRAAQLSTKPTVYVDKNAKEDVVFSVKDIDGVFVGNDFEVPIEMTNKSSSERTVNMTITLSSVYYTGVTRQQLKREVHSTVLAPNATETLMMKVTADEYLGDMVDHSYNMKINYLAHIKETKQLFASQDDFRLRTLLPEVIPSKPTVRIGEKFKVQVSITNPLKKPLTNCVFSFEAAGNLKPTDQDSSVELGDIAAHGNGDAAVEITAKRAGDCVVIVAFECNELGDVQGQCKINVTK